MLDDGVLRGSYPGGWQREGEPPQGALQGSKGAVSFRAGTHHLGPQEGVGRGVFPGLGHL